MKERDLSSSSLLSKLKGQTEKFNSSVKAAFSEKKREQDPRFWKLPVDEKGVGSAVIRLLPPKDWDEYGSNVFHTAMHFFPMPNQQFYVQNCPTTIQEKCPACQMNSNVWDDFDEKAKALWRTRKKRDYWICNIVVINDTAKPENNKKVFLWAMTKMFYDAVADAINGRTPEGESFNPFDVLNGANMKIQITTKGKGKNRQIVPSVSWSDRIGPMHKDDEVIEKYLQKTYALSEVSKEEQYEIKEYTYLENVLKDGFGSSAVISSTKSNNDVTTDDDDSFVTDVDEELEQKPKKKLESKAKENKKVESKKDEEEDDDLDFGNLDDDEDDDLDVDDDEPKTKSKTKSKVEVEDDDDLLSDDDD